MPSQSLEANASNLKSREEQQLFDAYSALSVDDKLAWFYIVYEQMGDSITPAAPGAAEPAVIPELMGDRYYEMNDDDQLNIMREIVECQDTEYSRAYGTMTPNNQLLLWYAWAELMGDRVVGYSSENASDRVKEIAQKTEALDFQAQISVFREVASQMGYSDVGPVSSQKEVGRTPSL